MTQTKTVTLKEIATFTSGGTPSKKNPAFYTNGTIPWITGADIHEDHSISARTSVTEEAIAKSAATAMPAGTIALVTRTSIGKVGIFTQRTAFSQDITAITPGPSVDSAYLVHFLESQAHLLKRESRGATIKGVARETVGNLPLTLTSLAEQRRIASILDEADAIRKKRRTQLAELERLRPTLFHQMFGEYSPDFELGDLIAEGPTNGIYKPASSYGEGTPILRIDSFSNGYMRDNTWRRVQITADELAKYSIRDGDIVINRVNALSHLGKSILIKDLEEPSVFESNMMRLRLDNAQILPEYVISWLLTSDARQQIVARAKKAINQASINQSDVRGLTLPKPSIDKQRVFTNSVNAIRAERDRVARALEADEELFAAFQHRAFRSEL